MAEEGVLKNIIISGVLISLFVVSILFFMIKTANEYGIPESEIIDTRLSKSEYELVVNRSQAQGQQWLGNMTKAYQEESETGQFLSNKGIIGFIKNAWDFATTPIRLLSLLVASFFGVQLGAYIGGAIGFILVLLTIFSIWRLWKIGD